MPKRPRSQILSRVAAPLPYTSDKIPKLHLPPPHKDKKTKPDHPKKTAQLEADRTRQLTEPAPSNWILPQPPRARIKTTYFKKSFTDQTLPASMSHCLHPLFAPTESRSRHTGVVEIDNFQSPRRGALVENLARARR